jgi:thiol-disulfide isomerase/thioredoxin
MAILFSVLALPGTAQPARSGGTNGAAPPAIRTSGIRLREPGGKARSLDELLAGQPAVFAFLGTECPVANSYAERLSQLAQRFGDRGVRFLGVNANSGEDRKAVGAHAVAFHLGFPVYKDEKQELAAAIGARVTPEVFLLDSTRVVRYRGAIDDSFATRTQRRPEVKTHFLADAVEAVLAGRAVATPVTTALGCAIARPAKSQANARVTFHRDVQPILQRRCQSCHRPGQVAPFSLLSYKDARSWAGEIREATEGRTMPPWLAEPGHGEFQDVRRLSETEIRTLAEWADLGMPEGSPKDAPAPKAWTDEWFLGKPDLVLEVPEPYSVSGTGVDEFRVFVLPTGLTEDKQVVAVDFRPGNARVVHHVVSFVDPTGQGRKLDAADPGPGYGFGPGGIKIPGAAIQGVWAPGNLPRFLPKGVGRPLSKNADVVIQVHYHKTGRTESDRTRMALYFAREPVQRMAGTAIVGPFNIDIPPNATRHEQRASLTLPIGMEVLNIMPHMHLLGKEMRVTATLPDGHREEMVWIRDWDYRWQDSYRYKEPLRLPAGTKIEISAFYDNSTGNPRQPNVPPKRVRFGEQTTDEMGFAIMEVVSDRPVRPTPGGG